MRRSAHSLPQVPTGVSLSDDDAEREVRDGSPAFRAWDLLDAQYKVGWVMAGKLMARKRPDLLPVYDDVVRCVLRQTMSHFWRDLRDLLRADEGKVENRLKQLRHQAELESISLLRIFDVLVWHSHRIDHRQDCLGHRLAER